MNKLQDKQVSNTLASLHENAAADALVRKKLREEATSRGESYKNDWSTAYLAIGTEEGKLLNFLAKIIGAKNIVEFGCSFGISTIYLAAAASDNGGRVITSDMQTSKVEGASKNLQKAGLFSLVEIRQGDAMQTLSTVPSGIDLLFLDGAKELYLPIFKMLKSKLNSRAIIFADNADHAGAQSFIKHILEQEKEYVSTHLFDGRVFITCVK